MNNRRVDKIIVGQGRILFYYKTKLCTYDYKELQGGGELVDIIAKYDSALSIRGEDMTIILAKPSKIY